MKPGDYTTLARHYKSRWGYSPLVLRALLLYTGARSVADVGAGTGKLTEDLVGSGLWVRAVEPNDAMRNVGMETVPGSDSCTWSDGSAEQTGLPDECVDWVCMASSFHWADAGCALKEFHRILRPGGYFTALWNPRDLDNSDLERRIEARIAEIVPDLKRVSSGARQFTQGIEEKLLTGDYFEDCVFLEAADRGAMDRARYLAVWQSVNDLQAQAGEAAFQEVLRAIEQETKSLDTIEVRYRTRAWTVRAKSRG